MWSSWEPGRRGGRGRAGCGGGRVRRGGDERRKVGQLLREVERIDHVVFDPVAEIARRSRFRIVAPAVLYRLVLGKRVGDMGEEANIAFENLRNRLGGIAPDPFVGI